VRLFLREGDQALVGEAHVAVPEVVVQLPHQHGLNVPRLLRPERIEDEGKTGRDSR
jgi:hypothetical protein